MKAILFGATGETGRHLIDEGRRRGYEITVFARPSSPFDNPDVRVVRGELTDIALLRETVRGSNAVLSALGPTALRHPSDLPITRATDAIISAMKQEHVDRLIAVSTGTAIDPEDGFDPKIRVPALLIKLAMPRAYQDIIGLASSIRASGLDWTMVRVAFLSNRPAAQHLNVGLYGHTKHSMTVSREDVARFMSNKSRAVSSRGRRPELATRRADGYETGSRAYARLMERGDQITAPRDIFSPSGARRVAHGMTGTPTIRFPAPLTFSPGDAPAGPSPGDAQSTTALLERTA